MGILDVDTKNPLNSNCGTLFFLLLLFFVVGNFYYMKEESKKINEKGRIQIDQKHKIVKQKLLAKGGKK